MSATALPRRRMRLRLATIDRSRAALWALLLTVAAYLWNLTESGYANSFYAAAVQAGTKSWKAFLFGSLDSSNFITVDKPPGALWVMALSGRIFGFSSASMLIPDVLEGVLAVALLHGAVKRWYGTAAGLLAGGLLAITPIAAVMFRFNNPDALLVCLLVASAYCLVRALEHASTRWLIAVGVLLGFAFLTKMLQAFLVAPGFTLVYALAAPATVRRRAAQLLAGGLAVLVSCGWWLAIVALWPVGSRPMIDGSPDNNIFNLIFGYNGLGRIFGSSGAGGGRGGAGGAVGGGVGGGVARAAGGAGGNFSGATGPLRLFNELMGGQASWLLPAALLALVAGLWWTRRAPRSDRTRAGLLLWGGWLLVTGAVFSFSSGVIHTYYTVALAPAIAALVAIGAVTAWRQRRRIAARALLGAGVALSAGWSIVLLRRTPSWEPWLVGLIAVTGVAGLTALLVSVRLPDPPATRLTRGAAVLAAIACLAGPLAYTIQALSIPHSGTLPSAGPSTGVNLGSTPVTPSAHATDAAAGGVTAGGPGDVTTSSVLAAALERGASHYRWVAATSGSQSAAELELASGGEPVMAIGGFNGEGGNLTLAQFKRYVAAGEIHYYVLSSGGAAPGGLAGAAGFGGAPAAGAGGIPGALFGTTGSARAPGLPAAGARSFGARSAGGAPGSSDTAITEWVSDHFKKQTIGGQTVYDLTQRS